MSGDLVEQMFGDIFAGISDAFFMSDEEMFAGLDERTVNHLRARLVNNPTLRTTLCRAARYRATHAGQTKRPAEFVYFVEARPSGLIKIGSASDPRRRVKELQTGSPEHLRLLAVTTGGELHERDLHARFATDRVRGEWFSPSPSLIALIGGLS